MRIEDTDTERSERKFEIEIAEAMKWLGLDWDEGPDWQLVNHEWRSADRGENGPYRQSERKHIYRKFLEQLLSEKKAYYCYCTKEELAAERDSMAAAGLAPKYSGHCRNLSGPPPGMTPELIRFRMPEAEVEFKDMIRGTVKFDASLFGDVVIAKDLDSPLYNFAVVVDDTEMGITHVIRGEEHLSNTPKQILIARALGFEEPEFGHLPLILGPNRKKLSKRYAETSLLQYREEGYLPEAIVNFLALLGWHPSHEREIFSREDLVREFDLKRVQKAGAIFDGEKLDWLNAQYIRALAPEEVLERLRPLFAERGIEASEELLVKLIAVEQERMKKLTDFFRLTGFFFELPQYDPQLLIWKGDSASKTRSILEKMVSAWEGLSAADFENKAGIAASLDSLAESEGKGSVYWPVRAALSGSDASPDPVSIAAILGKDESLRRLRLGLNQIGLAL